MNKAFTLLCALALAAGHATSALAQDTSGWQGAGTAADPYQIRQASDLALLATRVNGYSGGATSASEVNAYTDTHFKLMNDIDMQGATFTPIGNDAHQTFNGQFDGDGHTIANLKVNNAGYAGLFGHIGAKAAIQNLTLSNATVASTSYFTGAVVGFAKGKLSNVHVVNSVIASADAAVGGIGGTMDVTENCSVTRTTVTGLGGYVGGIAGELASGHITHCHATATTVNGAGAASLPIGGIVGNLSEANASYCYFTGTVNAAYNGATNMTGGGVMGRAVNCNVDRCFSRATVIARYDKSLVGGVVGALYGASVTNSYSTGRVDCAAATNVGGIVGFVTSYKDKSGATFQSNLQNCYTAGTINASTYQYDPSGWPREAIGGVDSGTELTVSNIYFDNQMADLGSKNYSASTKTLTAAAGPEGFTADVWTLAAGSYPRIKGIDTSEAASYSASALTLYGVDKLDNVSRNAGIRALGATKFELLDGGTPKAQGHNCAIAADSLVLSGTYGADTLLVTNSGDTSVYCLKIAPVAFEGEGSQASPYLLKSKDDMVALSRITTDQKIYFPGTYFKVTNDIDMQYTTDFKGICFTPDDVNARFAGIIDGDGHTLHHLALTGFVKWKTEPTDHFGDGTGVPKTGTGDGVCKIANGLIGRLDATGVLKNLNIASDARIEMFSQAGAFVGYNHGLVENCKNYANVQAISGYAGGIVGRNEKGGIIKDCFNAGNVTSGYQNAGGIAAACYGTIENCMNTGIVAVRQLSEFSKRNFKFAGGITSQGGGFIMRNCLNTGTVVAADAIAGGISGTLGNALSSGTGKNDIYNSLSYGTIITGDATQTGGIGGTSGTKGTIQGAYWDSQMAPFKAHGNTDLAGASGVTTGTLTSGEALSGFGTSVWDFTSGQYPTLKQFASEPSAIQARQTQLVIGSDENAYAIRSNATLHIPSQATAKLTVGSDYSIQGSTLSVPQNPTKLIKDTLTVSSSDYVKVIPLKTPYELTLAGNGSKESPYLIGNANDWVTLARFMAECEKDFEGQYVRVTADIDFTGVEFVPIGYDKVHYMQGDFDGSGHTVKGISYKPTSSYEGAFTTIGEKATVHDLTLEGTITTNQAYTAGFVGSARGTMVNCVNKIAVTSTRTNAAGFAANAYATARFTHCANEAAVSGSQSYTAGFVSNVAQGAEFVRCTNSGTVTNSGTAGYTGGFAAASEPAKYIEVGNTGAIVTANPQKATNVAGLCSKMQPGTSTARYELKKCFNTADITATGVVGGLFACSASANFSLDMDSCYNTGNIHAVEGLKSGGVAGIAPFYPVNSTYTNCWNTGNVTSDKIAYAGGLFGKNSNSGNASKRTAITNCWNSGNVSAGGGHGAGLAALLPDYATVDHCHNTGDVTGTNRLAGLVVSPTGVNDVISNCYNAGNVTAATSRAGGLQAYGIATMHFENCFNVGNVTSLSQTQGTAEANGCYIGGLAGTSGAIFTNCYNAGQVTGATQVGGLSGGTTANKTSFVNCYNAGQVTAPDSLCGGIVGIDPSSTRDWNSGNAVTNTFFATDFGPCKYVVGEGKSMLELCSAEMGDDYATIGDYMLPVLSEFKDSTVAQLFAAAVTVKPSDTYSSVSGDVHVGTGGGVKWTATPEGVVTISGNNVLFKTPYSGELTLQATLGRWSRTVKLQCVNAITTGIEQPTAAKQVEGVRYYNACGQASERPFSGVNICVTRYTDGTTSVTKKICK